MHSIINTGEYSARAYLLELHHRYLLKIYWILYPNQQKQENIADSNWCVPAVVPFFFFFYNLQPVSWEVAVKHLQKEIEHLHLQVILT